MQNPGPGPNARKAPGLSVFFPAYNDSGTIASLVITALHTARRLTPDAWTVAPRSRAQEVAVPG